MFNFSDNDFNSYLDMILCSFFLLIEPLSSSIRLIGNSKSSLSATSFLASSKVSKDDSMFSFNLPLSSSE